MYNASLRPAVNVRVLRREFAPAAVASTRRRVLALTGVNCASLISQGCQRGACPSLATFVPSCATRLSNARASARSRASLRPGPVKKKNTQNRRLFRICQGPGGVYTASNPHGSTRVELCLPAFYIHGARASKEKERNKNFYCFFCPRSERFLSPTRRGARALPVTRPSAPVTNSSRSALRPIDRQAGTAARGPMTGRCVSIARCGSKAAPVERELSTTAAIKKQKKNNNKNHTTPLFLVVAGRRRELLCTARAACPSISTAGPLLVHARVRACARALVWKESVPCFCRPVPFVARKVAAPTGGF